MPSHANENSCICLYILDQILTKIRDVLHTSGITADNFLATGGGRTCNSSQGCPGGPEALQATKDSCLRKADWGAILTKWVLPRSPCSSSNARAWFVIAQ